MSDSNPKPKSQTVLTAIAKMKAAANLTRCESLTFVAEKCIDDLDKFEQTLRIASLGEETKFHDLHAEVPDLHARLDKLKNRLRTIERKNRSRGN